MADVYITRAELKDFPYRLTDQDLKYLETLQDITKEIIDKFCNQVFSQEGSVGSEVEKKLDGNGSDSIRLPKKIITLDSIRIYASSTNYTEYDDTNFTILDSKRYIRWNVYAESTISARLRIYHYPEGISNIGLVGVWGWPSAPDPIKYLQGQMIKKMVEDSTFANKFSTEKLGDYTYQLLKSEMNFVADYELDRIIQLYQMDPIKYDSI